MKTISLEEALKYSVVGPFHGEKDRAIRAAILTHYERLFPEVVERLRWYMEQEEELMYYGPLAQNKTQRILALAETVTLPES